MFRHCFIFIFIFISLLSDIRCNPQSVTVLIIADGLRHDYLGSKYNLPVIKQLAKEGVLVPSVKPVFPSLKYPNIASLLTGVYAEDHEVIDSLVYDSLTEKNLTVSDKLLWKNVTNIQTIWDLHDKHKAKPVTKVHGLKEKSLIFDDGEKSNENNKNDTSRVQSLLKDFNESLKKCNSTQESSCFITLFINEPGRTAQIYGPESDKLKHALVLFDKFLQNIIYVLKEMRLFEMTNLILASTPGYTNITLSNTFSIWKYVSRNIRFVGSSSVFNVELPDNQEKEIDTFVDLLGGAANKEYEVFTKKNFPEKYHYKNSSRMQEIVVVCNPGHIFIESFKTRINRYRWKDYSINNLGRVLGVNGYTNDLKDMQTFLIRHGPQFVKNKGKLSRNETHEVNTVDIFALLLRIMNIENVSDRKANIRSLTNILSTSNKPIAITEKIKKIVDYASKPEHLPITVSLFLASLVIIIAVSCILLARARHRRMLAKHGFRYSEMKNNRRQTDDDFNCDNEFNNDNNDEYHDDDDDKQSLLVANSSGIVEESI